MAKTEY